MPAPTKEDVLFGRLAIKHNLATQDQIQECLALLQSQSQKTSLGKVLVAKGYISSSHFQQLAQHVKSKVDAGAPDNGSHQPKHEPVAQAVPSGSTPLSTHAVEKKDFSALAGKPIDEYLKVARELGASDFHYQVDAPPFMRINGVIAYMKHPVLEPDATEAKVLDILNEYEKKVLEDHLDVDFCYEADHGRYRANVMRQRKGLDAVFRIIPTKVPTLEDLHLPDDLLAFTKYRQGIVLITGPAGSGKSSTMAALVDVINKTRHDHIITVEDPIEYLIESQSCNVNQRHVKVHTESFASALRSAMRADPDYICVGEMRDLETVSMAITAAETGHLVFGTLHTTNAIRSVDRIIDIFPPKEQDQIRAMVSESLRGVISQQLIPRADGQGREPAVEILFTTPAVANLIREKKTFQLTSVMQTGAKQGMKLMDDSIAELLRKKLITREEAIFRSENPDRFKSS